MQMLIVDILILIVFIILIAVHHIAGIQMIESVERLQKYNEEKVKKFRANDPSYEPGSLEEYTELAKHKKRLIPITFPSDTCSIGESNNEETENKKKKM